MLEAAYAGEASASDDIGVTIYRHGHPEEAHFTLSLTPVRNEAGTVIGTFCTCTETTTKVRAERALRQSEARLNMVTDLLGIGWYTWWPVTGVLDRDDRTNTLWGLPPGSQVDATGALAAVHPQDQAAIKSVMSESVNASPGRHYRLDYRVIGADAMERWVTTRARAFQHEGRVGFAGVARDLTGPMRTKAALRASEARHRFLLELGDSLRSLDDPRRIMAEAAARLGRYLGAGRAGYGEIDAADAAFFTVEDDWTDGTMQSFAGRHGVDDFGSQIIDELRAGTRSASTMS